MIGEFGCGKAVPPDDPRAFADACVWLRDHRDEAVAMGERDGFCRAALDTGRADLPTELWDAASNPGFFGAVGKLFGKLFG